MLSSGMRNLLSTLSFLIILLTLSSCGSAPDAEKSAPTDSATVEERATIDSVVARLSRIFRANGYEGSFDKMPILVVSEASGKPGWAGRCVGIGNGTGKYIALTRWAFQNEADDEVDSRLTAVLLHEIGHCYFAREHDHELIRNSNYVTDLEYTSKRGRRQNRVDGVPATVMYVSGDRFPHSSIVTANREFLTYYVRELLGFERIRNVQDLRKFKSIQVRRKTDPSAIDEAYGK
ncbi:MAG: hypothetical protein EOP06_09050 [Proteobacteria bacterium]|nr:MAG: hypothetical protein EOP06_09050 [Pseudomonadota bacterium]